MGAGLMNPTHIVFLAVLGLLLFGAKRLPEVGRSLGTGMREFKTSISGEVGVAGEALVDTRDAIVPSADAEPVIPAAELVR